MVIFAVLPNLVEMEKSKSTHAIFTNARVSFHNTTVIQLFYQQMQQIDTTFQYVLTRWKRFHSSGHLYPPQVFLTSFAGENPRVHSPRHMRRIWQKRSDHLSPLAFGLGTVLRFSPGAMRAVTDPAGERGDVKGRTWTATRRRWRDSPLNDGEAVSSETDIRYRIQMEPGSDLITTKNSVMRGGEKLCCARWKCSCGGNKVGCKKMQAAIERQTENLPETSLRV